MTRLTITLEEVEIEALRKSAQREMRPTKDQVRYILRHALGLMTPANPSSSENSKSAQLLTETGAFAGTI